MDRRKFLISSLASTAVYAARTSAFGQSVPPASNGDVLTAAMQARLAADPLRPQFHLLPRHNWMNDPCAPRFHGGEYHMFFQYNPNAAVWGDMHWNHATSEDMVHWKHMPVAIAPTPGGFDAAGVFTGSVLPGMEQPTVLYTGVTRSTHERETIRGEGLREVQCMAMAMDADLRTWKKLDKPVIDAAPAGLKVTGFRDPCPWKDGDTWYLGVGSGISKQGGAVLLYSSRDGRSWTYLHPLAQGTWNGGMQSNPVDTGEMWECPDFFPLGEKHVLLYSTERKVYWEVGVFDKKELKFHGETRGLLDHGSYYAMKSMEDVKGRRILWGWVEETRSAEETTKAGWAGSMALPRVLTIDVDNMLRMDVPPEFAGLLRDAVTLDRPRDAGEIGAALAKMSIRNRCGHVKCVFKAGDDSSNLDLQSEQGGAPIVSIAYNGSAAKPALTIGEATLALSPDKDGLSLIELWMDGSVIEVFADKKEALTLRNYATSGDLQVSLGGSAGALQSLSVSGVTAISPDRLTT